MVLETKLSENLDLNQKRRICMSARWNHWLVGRVFCK